jgi:hypothetical protein
LNISKAVCSIYEHKLMIFRFKRALSYLSGVCVIMEGICKKNYSSGKIHLLVCLAINRKHTDMSSRENVE